MSEFAQRLLTALVLVAGSLSIFFLTPAWLTSALFVCTLLYIIAVECPQLMIGSWIILYPTIPFALLICLNQSPERLLLFVLAAVICSHDTGAYMVGKLIGKHKIAPSISPGKSWEGFIGGYIFSCGTAYLLIPLIPITLSLPTLFGYVLILNIAGTAGDFFESFLKRRVGIKDSGSILPGHGGLLDRFDSILFSIVALQIIAFLR